MVDLILLLVVQVHQVQHKEMMEELQPLVLVQVAVVQEPLVVILLDSMVEMVETELPIQ